MTLHPEFGEHRVLLLTPRQYMPHKSGARYALVDEVYSDAGTTTTYDEALTDWVTTQGSWKRVRVLGEFGSPSQARDYMRARAHSRQEVRR